MRQKRAPRPDARICEPGVLAAGCLTAVATVITVGRKLASISLSPRQRSADSARIIKGGHALLRDHAVRWMPRTRRRPDVGFSKRRPPTAAATGAATGPATAPSQSHPNADGSRGARRWPSVGEHNFEGLLRCERRGFVGSLEQGRGIGDRSGNILAAIAQSPAATAIWQNGFQHSARQITNQQLCASGADTRAINQISAG
jgi:hypothetical protein